MAQGEVAGVYLILGPSAEERERAYRLIAEAAVPPDVRDLCLNTFDGEQAAADEILATWRTVPLLGERRVVYVRRFDRLPAEEQDRIAAAAAAPVAGSVLVLAAADVDRRRGAVKALVERAVVVECAPPKGEALVDWILEQAKARGCALARDAASFLAEHVGSNLDALTHELEKVAAYVGPGGRATADDVAAVMAQTTPAAAQNEIFRLCDAVVEGRADAVLGGLDNLLANGASPLYILTMLAWHYRRLLAVKLHGGRQAAAVSEDLGLRLQPFAVERLIRQAARLSRGQLEDGLRLLLRADLNLKRGALPRPTLEHLVLSLLRRRA